jgi:hypothetical protein
MQHQAVVPLPPTVSRPFIHINDQGRNAKHGQMSSSHETAMPSACQFISSASITLGLNLTNNEYSWILVLEVLFPLSILLPCHFAINVFRYRE